MRCLLVLLVYSVPHLALAAVSISEVAWMGSTASANHEWIELHNDGDATDVTDWTLSDGRNLTVELSGTIPANTRVVLERTSDDTAPGAAFLLYTGALVNGGATLELRRSDGNLVDRIVGGDDWEQLGGDNTTKETAQYTAGGWVTAAPTPGAAPPANQATTDTENSADTTESQAATETESDVSDVDTATTRERDSENDSQAAVTLELPENELALSVNGPTTLYVNQPREFSVSPAGVGDTFARSLRFRWNFGDGNTTAGERVTHQFAYPGSYVVTVHGKYKRQEHVVRHDVTVLPVRFALGLNQAGDVMVHNEAKYDVDLSGFRLRGEDTFTFEPYTILKAQQTITIPQTWVVSADDRMLALYDGTGQLVASRVPPEATVSPPTTTRVASNVSSAPNPAAVSPAPVPAEAPAPPGTSAGFGFVQAAPAEASPEPTLVAAQEATSAPTQAAATAEAESEPINQELWLLVGVLCLAIVGIYLTANRPKPDTNPFTRPD